MAVVKTYTKLRDFKEDERFGEHVGAIMFALRNGPQTRDKVVAVVAKRLEGKTAMVPSRIVSFHVPRMVDRGLIEIGQETVETSKPKAKSKSRSAS